MTFTSKLFSLMLIAFVFIACQKEISPDELPDARPTNPATSDSVRLKLYVELDTLKPSGADTIFKMSIYYDAQHRLSNFIWQYYNSGVVFQFTNFSFDYSGSDTLPNKLFFYGWDNYGGSIIVDSSTATYIYDNAGKLVKIYSEKIESGDTLYTEANYFPSYLKTSHFSNGVLQHWYDSIENNLTIVDGNIISSLSKSYEFSSSMWWTIERYTSTYDQQKNPFRRFLQFYETTQVNFPQIGYFTGHSLSKNNVVQFSGFYDDMSGSQGTDQYNASYTYNSAGYPVTCRFRHTDWGNGVIEGKKLYFYY